MKYINQELENKRIDQLIEKKMKFIAKAKYAKALALAKQMLRDYPKNLVVQYSYAATLGDHQEGLTEKQIEKNRKTATKILKKVVDNIDLVPENRRRGIINEYFWFSRQPLKQYQHGVQTVREGQKKGYYSQGVGAVSYAQTFAKKGDFKSVMLWAKESKKAWENYFKVVPNYYNAWCWYALALGILGQYKEMDQALRKASLLAERGWDYPEFKEFQWMVWNTKLQLRKKNAPKAQKYWKLPPGWHISNLDLRETVLDLFSKESQKGFPWVCREAQKLPKRFPKESYAECMAAALYGDWSQILSFQKEKRMKAQAVRRLEKLLPGIQKQNPMLQMIIWNEIYYHSGQFLKQYQLGMKTKVALPGEGYFSMGVGASEWAYQVYLKDRKLESKKWAQKAVQSWEDHSTDSSTLAENCFYIQALALSGQTKKAEVLMKRLVENKKVYQHGKAWFDKYRDRLKHIT